MKRLTTLLALLLSCSMLAQGPVEFPWNPDADGDDFIGVNDLMALLGEFDSVFSEEGLYLSADSLSAMYDAGSMKYVQCQVACKNLPGNWKMPRLSEVAVFDQDMWLETPESATFYNSSQYSMRYLRADGEVRHRYADDPWGCFCVTKERPKVEYSFCSAYQSVVNIDGIGSNTAEFQECCDEKLENGWYPLGGFSKGHTADAGQAFWRWAE